MRVAAATLAALALGTSAHAAPPEVKAVRVTTLDFRTAVRVLTSEDVPTGEVVREGDEVVIRVAATAPEGLPLPAVQAPIAAMRLERVPAHTVLRVQVAPEVPFEASHEPGMLTVVFGEQPAPELRGPVTRELYQQLFPTGTAPGEKAEEQEHAARAEGISVGPATLRPYVTASWVDADILAFDNPIPVRDRYLQVAPGVTASLPLFGGQLTADYEPRLRFFSDIPLVNETSHFVGLRLDLPVGTRTLVRLSERYVRATLETTVVDPGHEYFFGLTRYTYWETGAALRVDLGARLFAEGEGNLRSARFDEHQPGGFFDYDSRALRVGLGYDVGSDLRAIVSYSYERIPPSPDRAIVESSAHSVLGTVAGQITPLTSASLTVGFRSQSNPLAAAGSASFTGVTLGGTLHRQLGHATLLDLQANRSIDPSSYDTNAYYVTDSLGAALSTPMPLELLARGAVTWLRNDYPNDAPGLSAPRRDDILAWTVGLGRQLGWRSWIRADYRRERRDSNLPGYDVTTDGFMVQFGMGLFGSGSARQ
ncbi:MAG TPA: outer membrane beta-barrel protein [Vicinamibacteria bacterium]|nr:outer membrane beta-barrel protein [Vicinamibacteria bacterium]